MPAPKNYKLPTAKKGESVYLTNPGGAVHLVPLEIAREQLRRPGFRRATADEIAELEKRAGYQTFDNPIATPFDQMLKAEPDVEPAKEVEPVGKA